MKYCLRCNSEFEPPKKGRRLCDNCYGERPYATMKRCFICKKFMYKRNFEKGFTTCRKCNLIATSDVDTFEREKQREANNRHKHDLDGFPKEGVFYKGGKPMFGE